MRAAKGKLEKGRGYAENTYVRRRLSLLGRPHGRRNRAAERLGILGRIKWITGKLIGEFFEEFLCNRILFFAARGKREKNFREGLQVVAIFGGFGYLLHPKLFVAMNASEPKEKSRGARKRADDVIGAAKGHKGVVSVRAIGKQIGGIGVCFFEELQGVEMFFEEHAVGIGFHAGDQRHNVEALGIAGVLLDAPLRQGPRPHNLNIEILHALGIRLTRDATEEALVVEEIVAGEDALDE